MFPSDGISDVPMFSSKVQRLRSPGVKNWLATAIEGRPRECWNMAWRHLCLFIDKKMATRVLLLLLVMMMMMIGGAR